MAIYLVQHGKALAKAVDPERGLSDEGRGDTTRIAEVAAGYGVAVSRIEHSGKKRARQTAEILAEHLSPAGGVTQREGIAPMDDVAPVAAELDPASNLMLVGHLPFMERLAGQLIAGDPELRVFKVQGGGILCLDRDDRGWHVRWALMPHVTS
jgi:phosphohistidine phosphatase